MESQKIFNEVTREKSYMITLSTQSLFVCLIYTYNVFFVFVLIFDQDWRKIKLQKKEKKMVQRNT